MKKWVAITKNGTEFEEDGKITWDDIKNDVMELKFDNNGQIISLPKNMSEYIQAKTASADFESSNIQIESRYIGGKIGNNMIRIRIDEKTNNISVEIE